MTNGPPLVQRLLARLGRITSGGRLIPQIDGLRFVAIAAVVLFHANGYVIARRGIAPELIEASPLVHVLGHGHYGVHLFFAISGFILALPFARARANGGNVPLASYFKRRLTRLEPPYLLVLLLYFVGTVLTKPVAPGPFSEHLLASAFYLHNLVYGVASTVNGVAWSLEVEIQFYVLAPLLSLVFAIRSPQLRRAVLELVWAVAIAAKPFAPEGRLALTIIPFFELFWTGFLLAEVHLSAEREGKAANGWWDVASLAGWPMLPLLWDSRTLTHWLFAPLLLILYTAALRGRWSSRLFASRWLVTIGGMCYSIYLIHYGVISAVGRMTGALVVPASHTATLLLQLSVMVPAVVVVCGLLFLIVERPCMRPTWPRDLASWCTRRWSTARASV